MGLLNRRMFACMCKEDFCCNVLLVFRLDVNHVGLTPALLITLA